MATKAAPISLIKRRIIGSISTLNLNRARFTISGLSPSSLMNLAKSIPPIDLDPVHELKSSQLNN